MNNFLYFFIILLRILSAPLIFILPLQSIILSVFLDIIDGDFACKVVTKKNYQLIDKNLDLWWFINILIYSFINYPNYKTYLLILFLYRLIGQLIFYFNHNRKVLMFFPNFFEWIFFLIFFGKNYYPFTLIVFLAKILQEWFLHIANLSIKEIIFKKKRLWRKD